MHVSDGRTLTTGPLATMPGPAAGLNLGDPAIYALAKRIYYKRFSTRVAWAGIDPDDGFQEVLLAILRRQTLASRYNPARSSVSNYLFLAMSGITINLADSARRRRVHEEVGDGQDDPADRAVGSVDGDSDLCVEDLAADMEIPVSVVRALRDGRDPFCAALDAGMDVRSAAGMLDALGMR